MMPDELVRASRFLSLHLRHHPDRLGLLLQPGGWVGVDELLSAAERHGVRLSLADLREILRPITTSY